MFPFIPSPIIFEYDLIFTAVANKTGRMQYYKAVKGNKRMRISQGEFLSAYNKFSIVAIKPIQNDAVISPIQMEIYIKFD